MSRIWMEGFEDFIPNTNYMEDNYSQTGPNGLALSFPDYASIGTGRISGQYSLKITTKVYVDTIAEKILSDSLNELYFRVYYKWSNEIGQTNCDILCFYNTSNVKILGIKDKGNGSFELNVFDGSYVLKTTFNMSIDTWYKIDVYIKISSSIGSVELKLDDSSLYQGVNLNTSTSDINIIRFGWFNNGSGVYYKQGFFDDIALNDVSGSKNNSWCGTGNIVGLRVKNNGNKSQWDNSRGWTISESGTTTTNLKITGHGLTTNDVIFNVTRNVYSIITKVDNDNVTTSSISGQTTGDKICAFTYTNTITAGSSSTNAVVNLSGHTLESFDVFVNVTQGNIIRRVLFVDGNMCYNYYSVSFVITIGETISGQTTSDSIKTFKIKYYPISDHYKTLLSDSPNPAFSNINTTTQNDIDLFDMEELVSDKGIASNSSIVAVSHNVYARERGAGSTYSPVFRINSVDYTLTETTLGSGTKEYQNIYENSPESGNSWTVSEIDALESGIKAV